VAELVERPPDTTSATDACASAAWCRPGSLSIFPDPRLEAGWIVRARVKAAAQMGVMAHLRFTFFYGTTLDDGGGG
jgi:hypothetical protein